MDVLLEDLCSRKVFLAARGKRTYRWAESRFRENIKRQTVSTRGNGGRRQGKSS